MDGIHIVAFAEEEDPGPWLPIDSFLVPNSTGYGKTIYLLQIYSVFLGLP